eukprot:scaffold4921_cov21-Tisochrysis_lutea.AAC.1
MGDINRTTRTAKVGMCRPARSHLGVRRGSAAEGLSLKDAARPLAAVCRFQDIAVPRLRPPALG